MPGAIGRPFTVPLPESSETTISRSLPTTSGSMCSKVRASASTAGDVHAALVGERVAADEGLLGARHDVQQLVDEVRDAR